MSKKALITLAAGVLSLFLMLLPGEYSGLALGIALVGSFLGIWYLSSLLFKSITLNKNEKLYLVAGTLLSLVAMALGGYGLFIFLYPFIFLVGIFSLRVFIGALNKTTSSVTSQLQDKVDEMEDELKKREGNQDTPNPQS